MRTKTKGNIIEDKSIIIRVISSADYTVLIRFFEDNNVTTIVRKFHPFPLTSETAKKIACMPHKDRYYIAIWNKRIVGLCMLRGWDEGFDIPSFGVFVDYRYQGHGIGKKMTGFAISEAKRLGCNKIRLSVYARNVRAMYFYLSLGFQEVARESCVVAGEPDEKIIMIKALKR